jgi:NADH dehydrogenase [ubiquinone] 1 alpha subcomplex assembly factor 5
MGTTLDFMTPPPHTLPPQIFDRSILERRRARAAARAADHDFLLTRIGEDFAERLAVVRRPFPVVADIGAHHGVIGRALKGTSGLEQLISLENTPGLLSQCDGIRVQGHPEALPLAPESLDLAVSALSLHLTNDVPGALVQIRRALKPDGLLMASLLGGVTLHELREAWLIAESEISGGVSPRVAPFADVRDLGGLLQRAGFALPVVDSETLTVTYATPLALMQEIKAMGASNMLHERSRRPVSRRLLIRAAEIYAQRFGLPTGRVPATFEIITLTAWVPHESQPKPLKPGSATTRLADALGTTESKLK